MKKQPFDIETALTRIRAAVAPFPKAAMFELAERGHSSPFEQLVACIISIRTFDEIASGREAIWLSNVSDPTQANVDLSAAKKAPMPRSLRPMLAAWVNRFGFCAFEAPSAESALEHLEQTPTDIALLIIEHDMDLVFRLAQRITVLVQGSILVEGPPEAIAADPEVRRVYLGERVPT